MGESGRAWSRREWRVVVGGSFPVHPRCALLSEPLHVGLEGADRHGPNLLAKGEGSVARVHDL